MCWSSWPSSCSWSPDRCDGRRGLREQAQAAAAQGEPTAELAELEAAREAKYREIRDAELDHRTGKLSDADFEAIDSGLRAEAVEILRAIDRAAAARVTPTRASPAPGPD